MKNKIFGILLSLVLVLTGTNFVYAGTDGLTVHLIYKDVNGVEVEKTTTLAWNGSRPINKIANSVPAKAKDNTAEYEYRYKWEFEGEEVDDSYRIRASEHQGKTDVYAKALYTPKPFPKATVHVKYLNREAEWIDVVVGSNYVASGSSWKISEGAFDDDISYDKTFEHDGKKYTFTGWDTKLPLVIENLPADKDYYFTAEYNIETIPELTFNCIDEISTGSGSWHTRSSVSQYTHAFANPEIKSPELTKGLYQFKYWKEENNDKQYVDGEEFTYSTKDLKEDVTIDFYAYWQPAITINLINGDEVVQTLTSFDKIGANEFKVLDDTDELTFDGWVDEDDNIIETSDTFAAPAVTRNGEPKEINLYATFSEKEIVPPVDPVTPTEPTVEPIVEPTTEPTVEPTTEPTVEPTQPAKPTKITPVTRTKTISTSRTQRTNTTTTYPIYVAQASEEEPISIIEDESTPLVVQKGSWALINLIATILTLILAVILLLLTIKKRYRNVLPKIIGALLAFVSVIIFIFTEDMSLPMVLVDKWTIVMVIIFIAQLLILFFKKDKEEEKESDI